MNYSNYINSKCFINIFEIKKINRANNEYLLECKIDSKIDSLIEMKIKSLLKESIIIPNENNLNNMILKVYPKTVSIIINNTPGPDNYFIDNSKLYKYDINGQNPRLTNGNFLIAQSDNIEYINKAFNVFEGLCQQIQTYFDGTNLKLIINNIEETKEGTIILTDDNKIFVRIGNSWFGK